MRRIEELAGEPPAHHDDVRALLSALANVNGALKPVSILTVRRELTKRRFAPDVKPQMELLHGLGEIEAVGGGFYLPIPTHVVEFGDWAVLLSGLPSQEISRIYGITIIAPGSARIVRNLPVTSTIARRQQSDWLGTPACSKQWGRTVIESTQLKDPYGWQSLQTYNVDRKVGSIGWIGVSEELVSSDGVHLLRNASGLGPRSYYLLKVAGNKVRGLGELPLRGADIRRLQFALRAISGASASFSLTPRDADHSELSAPFLPAQEARFLRAIGHVAERVDGKGIIATIPSYTEDVVVRILSSLGLKRARA
jgi:hypothetical protein